MTNRAGRISILIIALLFFCKALLLAFWITPLWEVPDETGHFAYARDLAEGKGLPVLGKAVIASDINSHCFRREIKENAGNYIAQHPPLYYFGAGAILKLATYLTDDREKRFKAPRLMSVLAGTLTLLVLYGLMVLTTGDRLASLGISICVGFIPGFSHMSSGTSHDITVTLFAALAAYFFVRFIRKKKTRDAYFMAVCLSLACVSKMTALLLVPPMLAFVMLELAQPLRARVVHMLGIAFTTLLLPGMWMLRTFHLFGVPFVDADRFNVTTEVLSNATLFDYLSKTAALETIYVFFWGMFGFAGPYREIGLLGIGQWPLAFFSLLSVVLVWLVAFIIVRRFFVGGERSVSVPGSSSISLIELWYNLLGNRRSKVIACWGLLFWAGLLSVFAYLVIYSSQGVGGQIRSLFYAGSVFIMCAAAVVFCRMLEQDERLVCYALLIMAFFVSVFIWNIYGGYRLLGYPWGTMGRYFFPLIPWMLVTISLPLTRWLKIPSWTPVVFAVAFAIFEMATFLGQVIPLWRNI